MSQRSPEEGQLCSFEGRDRIALRAEAWGEPSASPVLLLHGGGQTRHAWSGTCVALARQGWYAVALDLRGHGESDWDEAGDYSLDAFRDDLVAVASTFDRPPVLVGASLGGLASLVAVAETEQSLVAGVVLVDIAPRLEPAGVSRIVAFMRSRPDGFESLEDAADAVAAYLPHRSRPKDLSGLEKNLRLGADGRYRWHWDPRFLSVEDGDRASGNPDRLAEAARGLRVPTLLVRGKLSDLLSEEGVRSFLDLVPHADYADVSGAGHMVAGDRNDAFTSAVTEFLRGLPRS